MARSTRRSEARRIQRALMGDFLLEDIHDYRLDRHNYTIYVEGDPEVEIRPEDGSEPGMEHNMIGRTCRSLDVLEGMSKYLKIKKPILMKFATCGGFWDEGRHLIDTMLLHSNPITAESAKHARSLSSIIPLVADRWVMTPSTHFMFHYGTEGYSGLSGGQARTHFEESLKDNDLMLRLYVARLKEQGKFKKMPEQEIRQMLEEKMDRRVDVFLSADEAKEWGFIDEVYTGKETLRTTKINVERRARMLAVVRAKQTVVPAKVVIKKRR